MALDEFFESEVAIVAGVTAAAFSPRVRRIVRRGAVLGLAGMMSVGDAVAGAARSAAEQAREAQADGDGASATPSAPARRSRSTAPEA
jgi:hypothetical protein